MKKAIIISIVIIMLILFIPLPGNSYDDGGTREYKALTYKIVKWNRMYEGDLVYDSAKIYFYPKSRKTIDELWKEIDPNTDEMSEDETLLEEETTLIVVYPSEDNEETSSAEKTREAETSEGVVFPPAYSHTANSDKKTQAPAKETTTRKDTKTSAQKNEKATVKADKETTTARHTENPTEAPTTDEPYFAWLYGEVKEVHGQTVIVAEYKENKETNALYSVDYSKLRNADSLSFEVGDIVTVEYKYPVQETYPIGIVNLLGISHSEWNSGPDQGIDLN